MKSFGAVIPEPGHCEIRNLELPSTLEPDQMLMRTEFTLISPGTELAIYTGKHSNLGKPDCKWPRFPFSPGYSAVGRVQAIGARVSRFKPGDLAFYCGAHATHATPEEANVTAIPDGISAYHAVFAELGAIALNGVRMARLALGETVCVVGLGLVGLLATRFSRLCGVMPLLAADLVADRRAIARSYGADVVLDPSCQDVGAAIREAAGGRLADVVIEATGVPRVLAGCLPWARNQGRVVLLGSPHGSVEVNFYSDIHQRNLFLIGAHMGASLQPASDASPWSRERNRTTFLELVRRGDMAIDPLISRTIAPTDLDATYQSLARNSSATLGLIVDWSGTHKDRP